jgi:heme/copper-type cytochrome/quinol oxidase subunit 3
MGDYVFGGRREPEAPRTTEARGPEEVARAAARRLGLPSSWWAIAMLVATEGTLMGCFVATYYYLRIRAPEWPPPGIPEPRVVVPLVLAAVLAATSVPMQLASVAARAGRLAAARWFVLAALLVQAGYFAYEMVDFHDQLQQFQPSTDAYGSIYYTLLGADHAHVFVGLLLDVWLLAKLVRGLTTYRLNATVAVTWYWHFVNVLTLVVIGTLTSAAVI